MPYIVQNYYNRTSLYLVILNRYKEVIKKLLNYKVNIFTTNFKRQTILYLIIQGYSLGVFRLFLEREVNIAA